MKQLIFVIITILAIFTSGTTIPAIHDNMLSKIEAEKAKLVRSISQMERLDEQLRQSTNQQFDLDNWRDQQILIERQKMVFRTLVLYAVSVAPFFLATYYFLVFRGRLNKQSHHLLYELESADGHLKYLEERLLYLQQLVTENVVYTVDVEYRRYDER